METNMSSVKVLTVLGKVIWFRDLGHVLAHYGNLYCLRTNKEGQVELIHKGHRTVAGVVELTDISGETGTMFIRKD